MKNNLIISATLISALLLGACNGDEETVDKEEKVTQEAEKDTNVEDKDTEPVIEESEPVALTWEEEIKNIANNNDAASDKFYSLETFMASYKSTPEEVEQFKSDIISTYKDDSYLSNIGDHEFMLKHIFMSYIVEQNSEGPLKDFAFDYHQNMKYTYRGADTVDSESVKSNEAQMDKKLTEIK